MASKTTTVNISGTIFHMTESSYKMFTDYLNSVKEYFAKHEGKEEILADLENRMAEHFTEKLSPGKQVLLNQDVQALIDVMGRVEDFAAEEEGRDDEEIPKVSKRLYRDPENRIIAGICSGLANYFQIDVRLIRLLFFISIFFGGVGILIYGLLWIFVPEAQTTSEKEAMAGYRFDLAAIAKEVEEKVKDIKVPKGLGQKVGGFFKGLGQLVTGFVNLILKFILFILKIVSIFVTPVLILATVAFTLLMLSLAFHLYPYFIQLPLDALANRVSFYLFLMEAYMAGLVVFIALISVFMSPIKKRWLFSAGKGVALISLFLVGGLLAVLGGLDLAPRMENVIQNEFKNESKEVVVFDDLPTFKNIFIHHPIRQANIIPGEEYKVEFRGDFCKGSFEPEVMGDTLQINRKKILPYNPLCDAVGMEVVITVPDFERLSAWDSSMVTVKGFDFDQLTLGLFGHNQVNLEEGTAQNLEVYIEDGSLILGLPFQAKQAQIDAFGNSMVEISVTDSLYGRAHDDSVIRYKGDPKTSFSEEVDSGVAKFDSLGNIQDIDDLPPTTLIEAEDSFNLLHFNSDLFQDGEVENEFIDDRSLEFQKELMMNEVIEEIPQNEMTSEYEQIALFEEQPLSLTEERPLIWSELEVMAIPKDCKQELRIELEETYGDWIFNRDQFSLSQSDLQGLHLSTNCLNKVIEKVFR